MIETIIIAAHLLAYAVSLFKEREIHVENAEIRNFNKYTTTRVAIRFKIGNRHMHYRVDLIGVEIISYGPTTNKPGKNSPNVKFYVGDPDCFGKFIAHVITKLDGVK